MFDQATIDLLLKQMQQMGMVSEPTAMQRLASYLKTVPDVTTHLIAYVVAKQKLTEMKNELKKMEHCVHQLEGIVETQGAAACRHSNANQAFVNWMVSYAESYYSLAMAFQAKSEMLPRVRAYLNGQQNNPLFRVVDRELAKPTQIGTISRIVGEALQKSVNNLPAFLKP